MGFELVESGLGYWVDRSEGSSELPGILLMKALVERLKKQCDQASAGVCRLRPGG